MPLLRAREWRVAEAIAGIGYTNPFLPERIELEQKALGAAFVRFQPFLHYRPDCSVSDMFPNAPLLRDRSEQLLEKIRAKLIAREPATERQLEVYENLGPDYGWPGNIRELEQCVRSIMVRGRYVPTGRHAPRPKSPAARFLSEIEAGELGREELLRG